MAENDFGMRTDNINKSYGKKQALFDVSIFVPTGKIYGLLGPSGCGKTTLVKILAGILNSDSGDAFICDELMPSRTTMGKIGYMAQSAALYPTLTGYENLKFFGSLYGLKKKDLSERISHVTDLVDLKDDLYKKAGDYSGGMKQRLSLAIALLPNPSVLLLDEPTVGIDPLLRNQIWQELYTLSDQGVTILITTHVMDEAEKCHYLAIMREGRVLTAATPKNILQALQVRNIEEAFIFLSTKKGPHPAEVDPKAKASPESEGTLTPKSFLQSEASLGFENPSGPKKNSLSLEDLLKSKCSPVSDNPPASGDSEMFEHLSPQEETKPSGSIKVSEIFKSSKQEGGEDNEN